jgi:hypothetical protein
MWPPFHPVRGLFVKVFTTSIYPHMGTSFFPSIRSCGLRFNLCGLFVKALATSLYPHMRIFFFHRLWVCLDV